MTPTEAIDNAIQTLRTYADLESWDSEHGDEGGLLKVFVLSEHGHEPAQKALADLDAAVPGAR